MKLEAYRCKKAENPELYEQSRNKTAYGKIIPGDSHVFCRQGLRLYAVPYQDIAVWWRRIEEVASRVGCCSNDFSIHKLVLRLSDGSELMLKIGEGLYRQEPERLMEALHAICPHIPTGKPREEQA